MSDPLDYYDVQAMLRDERHEIRGEIGRAISDLRDDVLELGRALRDAVAAHGDEMAALSNRIEAVTRAQVGSGLHFGEVVSDLDLMAALRSAAEQTPSHAYDPARMRQAVRRGRERGCWVYIPRDELEAAGVPASDPPPAYRLTGRQRSLNGHTVLVSLHRVQS